jgi:hypothetical protein
LVKFLNLLLNVILKLLNDWIFFHLVEIKVRNLLSKSSLKQNGLLINDLLKVSTLFKHIFKRINRVELKGLVFENILKLGSGKLQQNNNSLRAKSLHILIKKRFTSVLLTLLNQLKTVNLAFL